MPSIDFNQPRDPSILPEIKYGETKRTYGETKRTDPQVKVETTSPEHQTTSGLGQEVIKQTNRLGPDSTPEKFIQRGKALKREVKALVSELNAREANQKPQLQKQEKLLQEKAKNLMTSKEVIKGHLARLQSDLAEKKEAPYIGLVNSRIGELIKEGRTFAEILDDKKLESYVDKTRAPATLTDYIEQAIRFRICRHDINVIEQEIENIQEALLQLEETSAEKLSEKSNELKKKAKDLDTRKNNLIEERLRYEDSLIEKKQVRSIGDVNARIDILVAKGKTIEQILNDPQINKFVEDSTASYTLTEYIKRQVEVEKCEQEIGLIHRELSELGKTGPKKDAISLQQAAAIEAKYGEFEVIKEEARLAGLGKTPAFKKLCDTQKKVHDLLQRHALITKEKAPPKSSTKDKLENELNVKLQKLALTSPYEVEVAKSGYVKDESKDEFSEIKGKLASLKKELQQLPEGSAKEVKLSQFEKLSKLAHLKQEQYMSALAQGPLTPKGIAQYHNDIKNLDSAIHAFESAILSEIEINKKNEQKVVNDLKQIRDVLNSSYKVALRKNSEGEIAIVPKKHKMGLFGFGKGTSEQSQESIIHIVSKLHENRNSSDPQIPVLVNQIQQQLANNSWAQSCLKNNLELTQLYLETASAIKPKQVADELNQIQAVLGKSSKAALLKNKDGEIVGITSTAHKFGLFGIGRGTSQQSIETMQHIMQLLSDNRHTKDPKIQQAIKNILSQINTNEWAMSCISNNQVLQDAYDQMKDFKVTAKSEAPKELPAKAPKGPPQHEHFWAQLSEPPHNSTLQNQFLLSYRSVLKGESFAEFNKSTDGSPLSGSEALFKMLAAKIQDPKASLFQKKEALNMALAWIKQPSFHQGEHQNPKVRKQIDQFIQQLENAESPTIQALGDEFGKLVETTPHTPAMIYSATDGPLDPFKSMSQIAKGDLKTSSTEYQSLAINLAKDLRMRSSAKFKQISANEFAGEAWDKSVQTPYIMDMINDFNDLSAIVKEQVEACKNPQEKARVIQFFLDVQQHLSNPQSQDALNPVDLHSAMAIETGLNTLSPNDEAWGMLTKGFAKMREENKKLFSTDNNSAKLREEMHSHPFCIPHIGLFRKDIIASSYLPTVKGDNEFNLAKFENIGRAISSAVKMQNAIDIPTKPQFIFKVNGLLVEKRKLDLDKKINELEIQKAKLKGQINNQENIKREAALKGAIENITAAIAKRSENLSAESLESDPELINLNNELVKAREKLVVFSNNQLAAPLQLDALEAKIQELRSTRDELELRLNPLTNPALDTPPSLNDEGFLSSIPKPPVYDIGDIPLPPPPE